MEIHAYTEEEFGYLIAYRNGYIGLYEKSAGSLCASGADDQTLAPLKLKSLTITPDFHLRAPLIVWLEVTRACNLRCRHCFVGATCASSDELSTDRILSFLDELRAMKVLCVVFSGGEPFIRPDFLRILRYAAGLGFIVAVVTNGYLLTDSLVDALPKSGVRITVSLDNLHFADSDVRDDEQSFAYLRSKLLLLKRAGVPCHVAVTMTRENLASVRDTFVWLAENEIGYREIPFSPIGRGALSPHLQLSPTEVKEAAQLWATSLSNECELRARTPCLTFDQCFDFAFNLVYMARACEGARFLCYVSANGDVYPCTTCAGAKMFQVGNIATSSFRHVWDESCEEFRRLSRWDSFTACGACVLSSDSYFCTNRCPPLSVLYHGSPCICGATAYDKGSLALRTRMLPDILGRSGDGGAQ